MTTKQAIKIVKNDIQIVESVSGFQINDLPLFEALQHLIDIAQRFEGAVGVDKEDNEGMYWFDIYHNGDWSIKHGTYKLYAIPEVKSDLSNHPLRSVLGEDN